MTVNIEIRYKKKIVAFMEIPNLSDCGEVRLRYLHDKATSTMKVIES